MTPGRRTYDVVGGGLAPVRTRTQGAAGADLPVQLKAAALSPRPPPGAGGAAAPRAGPAPRSPHKPVDARTPTSVLAGPSSPASGAAAVARWNAADSSETGSECGQSDSTWESEEERRLVPASQEACTTLFAAR